MICIHKWMRWSDPIKTYESNKQQWRVCKNCNKAEFRTLAYDKQPSISDVIEAVKQSRGEK
jgi:hypothetical protein